MQPHSVPDSPTRGHAELQAEWPTEASASHPQPVVYPADPSCGKVLDKIFAKYEGNPFSIRFWDGSVWKSSVDDSVFEIRINTEKAWDILIAIPDEAALGEQYINGSIDVRGDLYKALRALPAIEDSILSTIPDYALWLRNAVTIAADMLSRFSRLDFLHSQRRDAAAISYHYDKPSEFYQLWLGPSMVYSCAYFQDWNNGLTVAQTDKMDLICRKLGLKPHDRYLDIGCGWGSLILYANRKYGVSAHGISLSKEQVTFAEKAIRAANQDSACQVYLKDYREFRNVKTKFDKVSSVGMCEHVGQKKIDDYFDHVHHMLVEGGLFLNHGITSSMHAKKKRSSFIDRYVFPDGELLTLSEMVRAAEEAGFEVRDVENLREHYEETLHRWVMALQQHKEQVIALTNLQTYRIWELYMTGSAEAFRRGEIAVHQLLLSKNAEGRNSATKIRKEWYRPEAI